MSKESMSQFLNKEDLYKAKSERLERENEKLEQDLITLQETACENLFLEKVKKNEIIKKLREALEFYADKREWERSDESENLHISITDAEIDTNGTIGGKRARKTLKELDE